MKSKELTTEQRRIAINAIQLYEHILGLRHEYQQFRGGLRWKTVRSRDYLVKGIDRFGHQHSLGPRSPGTEDLFRRFTDKKSQLKTQLRSLEEELGRQAKFCVAAGVNRIPRIAADVVRLLDSKGLLGTYLLILGSHAIYAYEFAAGVQLRPALLQTDDLDLDKLLYGEEGLEIVGAVQGAGFLGLLRKVDKSFALARKRSFRAVNTKGFMVDLIRAPLSPGARVADLGGLEDLVAEPLHGLQWLADAPKMSQIVIAEDGYPVRFVVPDPRVFALHKLWLSLQPTRDPMKRKRDFRQGDAVASLALEYLNLSFEGDTMNELPPDLTSMRIGLIERLRSRRSAPAGTRPSSLPPGFDDFDDDPTESSN